ncbi:MAG: response regulator [Candidatus Lernaella stagnicola]|nr:response regulator [Candidatus Lernaella stagnicola]
MTTPTKILLVEDNQDLLDIIHHFLDAYGFSVIPAKNGQEALELFEREMPNIVLSDVLLPKVNGFQVCEKIKKSGRNVPVVLMSALYKTYNLQQEAKTKYGADEYLIKPLNLVEVARLLCRLLGIERPEHVDSETDTEDGNAKAAGSGSAALHLVDDSSEEEPASEASETEALPDTGTIEQTPIVELFGNLFCRGVTAKFKVTADGALRTAYFKNGIPVFVNSNLPEENFTQLVIDDGRVTADQLQRLQTMAKDRGVTVGKLLVENGYIDPADLAEYLLREVDVRLAAMLNLRDGAYSVEADDSWIEKIKRPELDIFDQVYQAVQRNFDEAALKTRYDGAEDRVVAKNEANLPLAGQIDWQGSHLEAFIQIDGEHTICEIIDESGQSELVVMQLLYTLQLFDMIRLR